LVGIDVSTARWDLALRPMGHEWRGPPDDDGRTPLVERLQTGGPTVMVLEATGGLARPVAVALAAADLPVVVVKPRHARDVAKAPGKLAHTARSAAGVLAPWAEAVRPDPRALPEAQRQALSGLLLRRRPRIDRLPAEHNRLSAAAGGLHPRLQAHIHWLEHALQEIDTDLGHRIQSTPRGRANENLWHRVPGVGPVLARTWVAQLPALGRLHRQALAALVGVAPLNRDRGTRRGNRPVWGGPAPVRAALYLGALVAVRHQPVLKEVDPRLRTAGTAAKGALTACRRTRLTLSKAMRKHQTPWPIHDAPPP
jgi:transposase